MEESKRVLHEGAYDPIVTKEQRVKANAPAKARQMLGQPKHMVPYLLAGFIKCSKCGLSFQGQSTLWILR